MAKARASGKWGSRVTFEGKKSLPPQTGVGRVSSLWKGLGKIGMIISSSGSPMEKDFRVSMTCLGVDLWRFNSMLMDMGGAEAVMTSPGVAW